jgi:hypothetical protein
MSTTSLAAKRQYPGRLYLLLGVAIAFFGVVAYAVQFSMQRLTMPWYMPIAATLGVVLVIASLSQALSVWRVLGLLVVAGLAGFEWWMLLGMRLPEYNGPVAQGQAFPAFKTARADGSEFTERDLEGDKNNVLVFFRGRW